MLTAWIARHQALMVGLSLSGNFLCAGKAAAYAEGGAHITAGPAFTEATDAFIGIDLAIYCRVCAQDLDVGDFYFSLLLHTVGSHHVEVDVEASAGCLRRADCAVNVKNDRILECLVDLGVVLGRVELGDSGVGNRAVEMYMHLLLAVGAHVQAEGIRHAGDLHKLRHAAEAGCIRIEDGNAAGLGNQITEAEAGNLVLAASDGDDGFFSDLAVAIIIISIHRFLQPVGVILLHHLGKLNGFKEAISAVCVDHELGILTDDLAHGLDTSRVFPQRNAADLHLDRIDAPASVLFHLLLQLLQALAGSIVAARHIALDFSLCAPSSELIWISALFLISL